MSSSITQKALTIFATLSVLGPQPLPEILLVILLSVSFLRNTALRYTWVLVLFFLTTLYLYLLVSKVPAIPDLKVFLLLALLYGNVRIYNYIDTNLVVRIVILANCILLLYATLSSGIIFRYPEAAAFKGQNSIYYGFILYVD